MTYTPPDQFSAAVTPETVLAARERAVALLTDRFADESLTEAEFEARLNWLSHAESVAQIEQLVAELSVPRPVPLSLAASSGAPAEERLLSVMSATARKGQWVVPSRLRVRAIMSEVKLDLRYASLPPDVEIDVSAIMANVRVIVPPEMVVESRVGAFMGAVRNDADEATFSSQRRPRVRLVGSCVMSEVRVQVKARSW